MGLNSRRALYISYDGLLEPLGQSQVLPYLERLSQKGIEFVLLTFEKPGTRDPKTFEQTLRRVQESRIRWIGLRYHKRPLVFAKLVDLVMGISVALFTAIRVQLSVVHCRSHVAALMGWILKRLLGLRFIFDMRGFLADERVDGGLWHPRGIFYRFTKWLEVRLVSEADEIVTLTERARCVVGGWSGVDLSRVSLIPTCVDLNKFSPPMRSHVPNLSPALIYTGSIAAWYLLGEMLDFYSRVKVRYPEARFNLLTRNQAEAAELLSRKGLCPPTVTCISVAPHEVPAWLNRAHLGLALYKPGWSRLATCPTKVGEYLAAGLPVVTNGVVGDMKEIIAGNRVGAVLNDFSQAEYDHAVDEVENLWKDPATASRCRKVAETYFSLDLGVERYWEIYQRLT